MRGKSPGALTIRQYKLKDWLPSLENIGKTCVRASKNVAGSRMKNLARALDFGAKIGIDIVSKNPKLALTTVPNEINFNHEGKGLYLRKFALWQTKIQFSHKQKRRLLSYFQLHLKINYIFWGKN